MTKHEYITRNTRPSTESQFTSKPAFTTYDAITCGLLAWSAML